MKNSIQHEPRGRRSIRDPSTPDEEYPSLKGSSYISTSKQCLIEYTDDERSLKGSNENLCEEDNSQHDFSKDQSDLSKLSRKTVDRSPVRSKVEKSDQTNGTKNGNCCYFYVSALFIVLLGVLSFSGNFGLQMEEVKHLKDCSFEGIQKHFNEDVQDIVLVAIGEIERFNKPSVITFLHRQGNSAESYKRDQKVMEILKYATCRLNGGSEFVTVTQADRTSPEILADPGKLITKYQKELAAKNVMLVEHLENMPEDLTMKFHFICDEITTYVDRALIVFTIQHDEDLAQSDYTIIENVLMGNFKHTKNDFILPLLARITNAIIRL